MDSIIKYNRKTVDGVWVLDIDAVWEIMYIWYNTEVSLAEPKQRIAKSVPKEVKAYFYKINCVKTCDTINKQNYPDYETIN